MAYYIQCRVCGFRALNTFASFDPSYGWKCEAHSNYNPHPERTPRMPSYDPIPAIIRSNTKDVFYADDVTWNTWVINWEDLTLTNWETY